MSMQSKHFALFVAASMLVFPSSSVSAWATRSHEDLPKFAQVSEILYRGGQPTKAGLEELKNRGIKTVVSLRHNKNQTLTESNEAKELGLNFKSLPMDGLHKPTPAQVKLFFKTVQDTENQPVFVHCEWGMDRTGVMVALYREEYDHWGAKKAYDEMVKMGFEKKYIWFADSVFDYEAAKNGYASKERPVSVRMLDMYDSTVKWRPGSKSKVNEKQ